MRLGLWGARADNGGLGAMTQEFFRHLAPARTTVVDLGDRGRGPARLDRFPGAEVVHGMDDDIDAETIRKFCDGLDVAYAAETFYRADFCAIARSVGCATVLHAMPELWRADHAPPDAVWAPTSWRLDLLPDGTEIVPVPVAGDRLPFRHRVYAHTFLHVAAPAMMDRNGTKLVLDALGYLAKPCKVVMAGMPKTSRRYSTGRVEVITDVDDAVDYWDRYTDDVDVLVLPRRYAGLSLPMQEAAGRGMPIVTLDLAPQNTWIPDDALVPAQPWRDMPMCGGTVTVHRCDPRMLATVMDNLAGSPALTAALSWSSADHARMLDWEQLGPTYLELLNDVVARVAW